MILVTGGTGLVGSHLLLGLCKKGEDIKATYRNPDKIKTVEKIFSYYSDDPSALLSKVQWFKADVTDLSSLEIAFKGVKKVYHAAALVSFDPRDDKKLLKTNIEGTANIVNLCIANLVEKLCFVSSIAALGNSVNGEMVTEENEWTNTNTTIYGISKHYAEMEVWKASQEGLQVVIVNPGVIIAPGFWKSSSGSFFRYSAKEPKYYLPSGTGFVAVNDVTSAMIQLMDGIIANQRYILVGENWTYKTFFDLLAKGLDKRPPQRALKPWMLQVFWRLDWIRSNVFGKRRRLSKPVAALFGTTEIYDNSKLKKDLNFEYEDLEESIRTCCAIFLQEFGD